MWFDWAPTPPGPIDDAVDVVRVDTVDGKPLAAMIHYACHGTSLGGPQQQDLRRVDGTHARVPGKASSRASEPYTCKAAAGDINPRVVGGLDGYQDNIEATWALGEEIGREVARVYRNLTPGPLAPRGPSGYHRHPAAADLPGTLRRFSQYGGATPTTVVRIGDLMWMTFPGEMFSNIGKQCQAASPATHAFLMGYTNGYIGYFPEQKAYAEGGYEVPSPISIRPRRAIYLRPSPN